MFVLCTDFLEHFYEKYGSFIPLCESDVLEHLSQKLGPDLTHRQVASRPLCSFCLLTATFLLCMYRASWEAEGLAGLLLWKWFWLLATHNSLLCG